MAAISSSLFDTPTGSTFGSAADWLTGTLLGSVAVSLCVIAVAVVGLMLMTGRLAVREGVKVAIGCFVLLGAPVLGTGLRDVADVAAPVTPATGPVVEIIPEPMKRPPANYDPYAGASLRRD